MYVRAKRLAARLGLVGLITTVALAVGSPTAHADASYTIAWTGIGIYPRTSPSMDSSWASDAIADGTLVTIVCELEGQAVSNGVNTSTIWERLSDGSYVPNAFVATGVDGWTPGVSGCDSQGEMLSPVASGWAPACGASTYFSEISVNRWANGDFQIVAAPFAFTRAVPDPGAATVDEWHAIQSCVEGLYGTTADSIFAQLECHQRLALTPDGRGGWATGETYDLESWRPTFSPAEALHTRCGNSLNGDHSDDPIWSGRPDEGYLDFGVSDNIG